MLLRGRGAGPDPAGQDGVSWNCTTWLDLVVLLLAGLLVVRFVWTGGRSVLRMVGGAPV
ncbi:hypothetical protein AB0K15_30060 [Amycolatopsis sp. NPDC049253]|uniref:hypothetical protein n=1 Tax=Amycolatopsis sp. NPDC049253 TaxID=3155274 RepID=UPI00343E1B0C